MSRARRVRQHDGRRSERDGRMSADMPMLVTVEEAQAIYRLRQLGNAGDASRMLAIPDAGDPVPGNWRLTFIHGSV